jgi:hypothetical protein
MPKISDKEQRSSMSEITIISESATPTQGSWVDGAACIDAASLNDAIGWELKPEGLCREDTCVPVEDRARIESGNGIDIAEVAQILGRPSLLSSSTNTVTIGQPSVIRSRALSEREAPNFMLKDLDGEPRSLSSWAGKKRLLVAFSSW